MSIREFFEDDDDTFPLSFVELNGEHSISESIRKALIWASIQTFLANDKSLELVDTDDFSDAEKKLSQHVVFHGPFDDLEEAVKEVKARVGVLVAPRHEWTAEKQFVHVAVLAN